MSGCHWNGCGACRVQGWLLSGGSPVNNSATPLAATPSQREPRKAMPPLRGWSPRTAERFFGHLKHMLNKGSWAGSLQPTEWPGPPPSVRLGAAGGQRSLVSIEILATLVLETNHQCHPDGGLSHPTLSTPTPD